MFTPQKIAQLVKDWDNILLISHISPDGDTLGSATALMRAFENMGKKVKFACGDNIAKRYNYLFEGIKAECEKEDYIIVVDIASPALMGDLCALYEDKIDLVIDHHASHNNFGKVDWVDVSAPATTQMIYELIIALGQDITKEIANAVYTGLSTDTGCFKYPNVTPKSHMIAAELLKCGADAGDINRWMFETKTRGCIKLEGAVMRDLEFLHGDKIVCADISRDFLAKMGARESDLEGLPSIIRGIEGVVLSILLKEKKDGTWKVSLRSTYPIDSSEICQKFGGGGHKGAAGCSFSCDFDSAKAQIIGACIDHLEEKGVSA